MISSCQDHCQPLSWRQNTIYVCKKEKKRKRKKSTRYRGWPQNPIRQWRLLLRTRSRTSEIAITADRLRLARIHGYKIHFRGQSQFAHSFSQHGYSTTAMFHGPLNGTFWTNTKVDLCLAHVWPFNKALGCHFMSQFRRNLKVHAFIVSLLGIGILRQNKTPRFCLSSRRVCVLITSKAAGDAGEGRHEESRQK